MSTPSKQSRSRPSLRPRIAGPAERWIAMTAFTWAILAFANQSFLHWIPAGAGVGKVLLSHWTEKLLITLFGIYRIIRETNRRTRIRLMILIGGVAVFWWLIPAYTTLRIPTVGGDSQLHAVPGVHVPGTLTFFLSIPLVLLFGRRLICGYFCPCVAVRDTVGEPFRVDTPRGEKAFRWRHLKWPITSVYLILGFLLIMRAEDATMAYGLFSAILVVPYFASFVLSPAIGNRSYCRWLCPFAGMFGILNRLGAFRIRKDEAQCSHCGLCDQACDMGIPLSDPAGGPMVRRGLTECMGCSRCEEICPSKAIKLDDARRYLRRHG